MKATIFHVEEKILCHTVDKALIVVSVWPRDIDGYDVTIDVNGHRIDDATEHYEREEYAMLAYDITKQHIRTLAEQYQDVGKLIETLKRQLRDQRGQ